MTSIIIIALIVIAVVLSIYFRKRNLLKNMEQAVSTVITGTYFFLKTEYLKKHKEDLAKGLAGSVTIEIFAQPVKEEKKEFNAKHSKLIKNKLAELSQYEKLCDLITDAYRVKIILATNSNNHHYQAALIDATENLIDKGIFKSDRPAPSAEFPKNAESFLLSE